jgi:hypothetical protein
MVKNHGQEHGQDSGSNLRSGLMVRIQGKVRAKKRTKISVAYKLIHRFALCNNNNFLCLFFLLLLFQFLFRTVSNTFSEILLFKPLQTTSNVWFLNQNLLKKFWPTFWFDCKEMQKMMSFLSSLDSSYQIMKCLGWFFALAQCFCRIK